MLYTLIYLVIGVVVALCNNHLYTKIQKIEDTNYEENPAMIIALLGWALLWPIGVIIFVDMLREYIKLKRRGNNQP